MTLAALTTPATPDRDEDSGLAARVARGDSGSFDELVRLFEPRVTRLAHRLLGWDGEVEDVVQDVFITAFEKAGGFRRQSSLWTWLMAITLNRCRTYQRRQRVIKRAMEFLSGRRPDQSRLACEPTLAGERVTEVRAAVAGLRPIYREAIVLFYLEHKSIDEICNLLGVSASAIEVRLHRARAELRAPLKSLNAD